MPGSCENLDGEKRSEFKSQQAGTAGLSIILVGTVEGTIFPEGVCCDFRLYFQDKKGGNHGQKAFHPTPSDVPV